MEKILKLFESLKIEYRLNESLKKHTYIKIGGNASFFVIPSNEQQMISLLSECKSEHIPYFILGNGSNIVFSDDGFDGIIIETSKLNELAVNGNTITAGAGVTLAKLASFAYENGLTGLEFAQGIPGTVGGGVFMNAGAYGSEMKDIVFKTIYLDENEQIKEINNKEHQFDYRHSFFSDIDACILRSTFLLCRGSKETIKEKMRDFSARRTQKQPLEYPSAGSAFKRPNGYYAAKLIEDCGLKGFTIGGARVSEKHAGFIINCGNATCEDVQNLVKYIKDEVYKKCNILLECEIIFK